MPPGVYVALPSVLVTASAATAARASLSEALAVGDAGSVAVTVLTSGFVSIAGCERDTGALNVSRMPAPRRNRRAGGAETRLPGRAGDDAAPGGAARQHVALAFSVTPRATGRRT